MRICNYLLPELYAQEKCFVWHHEYGYFQKDKAYLEDVV